MTNEEIFVRYFVGSKGNEIGISCCESCDHSVGGHCTAKTVQLELRPTVLRKKGFPVKCLTRQVKTNG